MATAHLLASGFRPNTGLHQSSVDELYHVRDIMGWTDANTQISVFAAVPREIGIAHPDIGDAVCVNIFLYQKISTTEAKVGVSFRNTHSGVYRVRSSMTRGYTGSVMVPNWALSNGMYKLTWASEPREYVRRVETRYLRNGSLTDTNRGTMLNLVGSVFRFPDTVNGIPYLLKSPSIVDYAPGLSRLVYTFETSCRLLAMPIGTLSGQNIALPELGYLGEWFAPDGGIAGTPYAVQVRPWQARYRLSLQTELPYLV